jgi:N-acetylglucosaminyldiphosphoundecaprenol N-acetyl-beta-D-mannosaminyltransferase
MQRVGLEWLWRLSLEPGRLWRRYAITNTRYLLLLIRALGRRIVSTRLTRRGGSAGADGRV